MSPHPRRIVFLGTHGQYNIGDELLLETFLTRLGSEHHYVVNSYDPDFTRAQLGDRFSLEVIDTASGRLRLLRELLRCDVLVFGGGSIIKELYASTGRNRYSTLLMILGIVTFAHRIARRPIAMLNVGVGPLPSPRGRRLARRILSQVDELTVRDERSAELCRSFGVAARTATDAVFSADRGDLLGAPRDRAAGSRSGEPEHASSPTRIALNLNFDIANPSNWEFFLSRLAVALERVHRRHPLELHALPMQAGFKEHHDAEIIVEFAARVPSIPFVDHALASPSEVAGVIVDCDIVVSERFHAIVMASILGVPCFVLSYDVKVAELANLLGLESSAVDINEPFDAAVVEDGLVDLIARRDAESVRLAERATELRRRARRDFADARDAFTRLT
ncbi:polysaccharide pyruvyl transferase family protein [Homoserinibacter sp. GY 40078]|uniref:polysaccharide pyruvyl transferase family protein n=1 Tax=Homoserinibacter sp. GY 40078 TaxID=2603275 RepID=UPI0011C9E622|nr:polysaccharide pyruvyl transferase family protein [Homoserinibacter sp. GY 40078]TXK17262.1 hypothetical protein FVQ89_10435 [Homoserinibacter sp. GY 40078]